MTHTYKLTVSTLLCAAVVLLGASIAHADTDAAEGMKAMPKLIAAPLHASSSTSTPAQPLQAELREQHQEMQEKMNEAQEHVRAEFQAMQERIQDADTPEERKALLEEAQAEFGQKREELQEQREEMRGALEEAKDEMVRRAQERAAERVRNMVRRLSAAGDRLTKIADRIAERIAVLTEEGSDMTEASTALAIAEEKIADAQEAVAAITALLEEALASETPRDYLDDLRDTTKSGNEAVQAAHEALKDTVNIIKSLVTPEDGSDE